MTVASMAEHLKHVRTLNTQPARSKTPIYGYSSHLGLLFFAAFMAMVVGAVSVIH